MQRVNPIHRASSDQPWQTRVAWGLGSLAGFLLFWEVMALIIQHRHLPTPTVVFTAMMREAASGELMFHIGMTLFRVAVAFVFAMLIGSAIDIVMGRNGRIDQAFDSWLILFLNLPALVVIAMLQPHGAAGLAWLSVAFFGVYMLARLATLGWRVRGTTWMTIPA